MPLREQFLAHLHHLAKLSQVHKQPRIAMAFYRAMKQLKLHPASDELRELDDLLRVKGIGPFVVKRLRKQHEKQLKAADDKPTKTPAKKKKKKKKVPAKDSAASATEAKAVDSAATAAAAATEATAVAASSETKSNAAPEQATATARKSQSKPPVRRRRVKSSDPVLSERQVVVEQVRFMSV